MGLDFIGSGSTLGSATILGGSLTSDGGDSTGTEDGADTGIFTILTNQQPIVFGGTYQARGGDALGRCRVETAALGHLGALVSRWASPSFSPRTPMVPAPAVTLPRFRDL